MTTESVNQIIATLGHLRLLPAEVTAGALADLASRCAEPRVLAKELLARDWLTAYQVNQLLSGKGKDLLLGSYVLLEKLGEGGMGAVFKARHTRLDRIVAVKVIRKDRVVNTAVVRRFQREIRVAAQLNHPHIVRAFDADEVDGAHLLVMELVEGAMDLAKLVKRQGPLPIDLACDYLRQAALGLQHAHERGLVHRDIKPQNLLISYRPSAVGDRLVADGRRPTAVVKILDLGLARLSEADHGEHSTSALTQEGAVMGTLDYIAPEQARDSHNVDIRADLYSLGCTLYFLLTGQVPFPGGTATQKLMKHQLDAPLSVQELRPDVPDGVAAIVARLMAKKPEHRFQTPAELAQALQFPQSTLTSRPEPDSATIHAQLAERPEKVFASMVAGDTLIAKTTLPSKPAIRPSHPVPWKWLVAGGAGLIGLLILVIVLARGGGEPLANNGNDPAKPPGNKPVDPARQEKLAKEKREAEEAERQRRRVTDAEEALLPLETKANGSKVAFAEFAKGVQEFKAQFGGTPAAIKAAEMLMKLPSPLDDLDRKKLPEDCREYWRALGRDLPEELVGVLGEHRRRHWEAIGGIAYSPDGKLIAVSITGLFTIFLYDSQTMQLVRSLRGHTGNISAPAFSPDSRRLASVAWSGGDFTLRLWDTATAREVPNRITLLDPGLSVTWLPQGDGLLVNAGTQVLRFQADNLKEEWRLDMNQSVRCVAVAPDGKRFAAGLIDGTIRIFDLTGEKPRPLKTVKAQRLEQTLDKFPAHYRWVRTMEFLGEGDRLAALYTGGWASVWSLSQENSQEESIYEGPGTALAFVDQGKLLAVGAVGGHVYDSARKIPSAIKSFGQEAGVLVALAFAPDGKRLVSGGQDGTIRLWDAATGKEVRPLTGPVGATHDLALTPDDATLASVAADGVLRLWDPVNAKVTHQWPGQPGATLSVAFSPDGTRLVSGGDDPDRKLRFWKVGEEKAERVLDPNIGMPAVAFSPDGKHVVSGSNHHAHLRHYEVGRDLIDAFDTSSMALSITDLVFSPDGRKLLTGHGDSQARIWEFETRRVIKSLPDQAHFVKAVAYHPDGRAVATAASDDVWLWDLERGGAPVRLNTGVGASGLSYSPNGQYLAVMGGNGKLAVFDTGKRTKDREWQLPGPARRVRFAGDGRHLATANANGTVYIFRIGEGPPRPINALEASRRQEAESRRLAVPVTIENSVGMKLNLIPTGRFLQGSTNEEGMGYFNESPRHAVTLTRPYFLGMHEVTNEQFQKVTGQAAPSAMDGPRHPVHSISWKDAVGFCEALTALPEEKSAQRMYRLPTEVEWEYACRAGSQTMFSFGDDQEQLGEYAWHAGNDQGGRTHPVGQKKPNPWGLFDMHGNVWEWCADLYEKDYYRESPATDPPGPKQGLGRIYRGGARGNAWQNHRCATRNRDHQSEGPHGNIGFRVVCEFRPPQITNAIGMKLARIPAGKYLMGSPAKEPGRQPNEGPHHEVTLTRPFHIGVHEVTQAQYEKILGKNPAAFNQDRGGGLDHPVETVNWEEAMEFCQKLSELDEEKKAGRVYRLPTEAEWEYACRAGTVTAYSFGDDPKDLQDHAWFRVNAPQATKPVGTLKPNPWGLFDMHGNVWEWTLDPYYEYSSLPATDPRGPLKGDTRPLRGGGLSTAGMQWDAVHLRSVVRYPHQGIKDRINNVGFRVVCEIAP